MDLNTLYDRRGKSLMMAALASSEQARSAHIGRALGYVARIAEYRRALVADAR